MSKKRDDAIFWSVIAILVVVSAFTGLGTEVGRWAYEFPWSLMFFWIVFTIVLSSVRKLHSQERNLNKDIESWC
jgi:hypothetical protein